MNRKLIVPLLILLSFPVSVIPCCELIERKRRLPNGYRVVYIHNSSAGIVDRKRIGVVSEHILDWMVVGNSVIGKKQDGTVFELNTETGKVIQMRGWRPRQTLSD